MGWKGKERNRLGREGGGEKRDHGERVRERYDAYLDGFVTLHHTKMHQHTQFVNPTSNNIGDMLRTGLY